jgi:hypothetical protein
VLRDGQLTKPSPCRQFRSGHRHNRSTRLARHPRFPKPPRYMTLPEYGSVVVDVSDSAPVLPRRLRRPRRHPAGGIRWWRGPGCCAPRGSSVE